MGPLVAPVGTCATIWAGVVLVMPTVVAAVPLKVTVLLKVAVGSKPTVMVTGAPTGAPSCGVKVGAGNTVKPVADVAWETPSTVMLMGPLVAFCGTGTTIWVGVLLVTTAAVPLKATRLLTGPTSKPAPVIVTFVPTVAPIGKKPEMAEEGVLPHPERKKTSAPLAMKYLNIHAP